MLPCWMSGNRMNAYIRAIWEVMNRDLQTNWDERWNEKAPRKWRYLTLNNVLFFNVNTHFAQSCQKENVQKQANIQIKLSVVIPDYIDYIV